MADFGRRAVKRSPLVADARASEKGLRAIMNVFIELSRDEILDLLPYMIIAETTRRSVWGTGRRKRLFSKTFTEAERKKFHEIAAKADRWAFVTGAPESVKMTSETLVLWRRLADFCYEL